jgi:hypothetical protein
VTFGRLDQWLQPAEAGMDLLEELAVGELGGRLGPRRPEGSISPVPDFVVGPTAGSLCHGADSRL